MQKILLLFAFVCLALPALNAQSARRVEVLFYNSHTKTDLANIKAELGAQKILLDYTHTAFDADGRLTEIAFTVDFQDGFKGAAETKQLPGAGEPKFGFYRDPRAGAASPFGTGEIK